MAIKEIHQRLLTMAILLLTLLFIYTGASKLMHLETFQMRLELMPLISPYANWISWGVPFLELVIAGLLWFPKYRKLALYAGLVLLGLFTTYILVVLNYSESIPCSCGGVISSLGWEEHILFNTSFMVLALAGIIWNRKHNKPLPNEKHYVVTGEAENLEQSRHNN